MRATPAARNPQPSPKQPRGAVRPPRTPTLRVATPPPPRPPPRSEFNKTEGTSLPRTEDRLTTASDRRSVGPEGPPRAVQVSASEGSGLPVCAGVSPPPPSAPPGLFPARPCRCSAQPLLLDPCSASNSAARSRMKPSCGGNSVEASRVPHPSPTGRARPKPAIAGLTLACSRSGGPAASWGSAGLGRKCMGARLLSPPRYPTL